MTGAPREPAPLTMTAEREANVFRHLAQGMPALGTDLGGSWSITAKAIFAELSALRSQLEQAQREREQENQGARALLTATHERAENLASKLDEAQRECAEAKKQYAVECAGSFSRNRHAAELLRERDAARAEAEKLRLLLKPLLFAGEELVAKFGSRNPAEFVQLAMDYTKAHNAVEAALSTPPAGSEVK